MLFPTMIFGFFFLFVYATAWSLDRENGKRKLFLLAASWVFYGWWDWRFVGLLIVSALLNWAVAKAIASTHKEAPIRPWFVALGVVINLTILGFFKYYGFFVDQLGVLLKLMHWQRDLPLLQVVLPVGISFFTFQGMSYIIDVHRGKCPPAKSLLDVMLLMSFFPHLVAGPIVRASDLLPQFDNAPRLNREEAAHGLLLIAWGLFKKTVIASELAVALVDPVFFDPKSYGAPDLIAATYGYAVQIYCDFSAYSDIAIGIACLLGYRFPRNFNQPYRSTSLQEFWRRWHMSLSGWLRDYLYIPLGGGRGGLFATCRNVIITMVLGGVWHGAAWTFVAWGAIHGVVLAIERVWRQLKPASWPRWPAVVGLLITFHVVCLGWILFRSESFTAALDFLHGFGDWSQPVQQLTPYVAILIVGGLAMHNLPPEGIEWLAWKLEVVPAPLMGLFIGAAILLVEAIRQPGVAPFIYYQF
jgi:D-alanyl-lipoteichoic acid acyltransferase DltB (MBOAT superfamily)